MTVPVHGLPPLLHVGLEVAAVPPDLKGSRWHRVAAVSDEGGSGQLVAFADVQDLGASQALVGKTLLARVDELPEDLWSYDVDALLGREVVDEVSGSLGTIVEVMRGAAQDVWVMNGPYGEVLIPVVEEVVGKVPAEGVIMVRAPRGSVGSREE